LLDLAVTIEADLVVIGPEGPLVAGVADELRRNGVAVFGPSAEAARIEGSKTFAKDVLRAAGVPAAATLSVARTPCVVKADGLASGKGVFVCRTAAELDEALRAVTSFGSGVVIEELLEGEEVSLFALSDGRRLVPLAAAQDFKRIGDGDVGPNTGGMGAYSPVSWLDDAAGLVERIHQPVINELARRGAPFVGCLFAGLMMTAEGPKVLEFNARFGDPETQVLMPRLEGDLLEALAAAAHGDLSGVSLGESDEAAVTVVLAAPDYPGRSDYAGIAIDGAGGGGGDRCAGLPQRDGGKRWARRHQRRQNPLRDRDRPLSRRRARPRLRRGRPRVLRGRAVPAGHRGGAPVAEPLVGILVGSESDRARMQAALDELDVRAIPWEFEVRSAHRAPDAVAEYAKTAAGRGLKVLICGAGLAAALPGVVAAHTELPVIGVPLRSSMSVLDGLDALLSIVQMPPGVPVATVGVDNAKNAAVLAARILALLA